MTEYINSLHKITSEEQHEPTLKYVKINVIFINIYSVFMFNKSILGSVDIK